MAMGKLVRSIDIDELRFFCAACDMGSIGKAARMLHMTQPALSKRIRLLEGLAGTKLLARSPRGVKPTPSGSALYSAAQELLVHAESLESLMTNLSGNGNPVRLASSPTVAEFVLPRILADLASQAERYLSLELSIANSESVRTIVRKGRADLGIAVAVDSARVDALQEINFLDDEVVIAVPNGHPWSNRREISSDQFSRTQMIVRDPNASSRRLVESKLAEKGLSSLQPLAEVGSTTAVLSAAEAMKAPAILSALAVRNNASKFSLCRVRGVRFKRHFVLIYNNHQTMAFEAKALANYLRVASPSGPGSN